MSARSPAPRKPAAPAHHLVELRFELFTVLKFRARGACADSGRWMRN